MSYAAGAAQLALVVAGAPLVIGLMRQVRAALEGRAGGGVLQPWRDLRKQLGKQQTTPQGTTMVFTAAPAILAGTTLLIAAIAPIVATGSPLDPVADLFAVVGLLFLGTVALTLAGIDTGTSFGGMGASREITIAALVEPTILLAVFALSIPAGSSNLGALVANTLEHPGHVASLTGVLAFVALVVVIIAETGRLPVDNPATHLELTMVHEAMVLEIRRPTAGAGRMGLGDAAGGAARAAGESVLAVGDRRGPPAPARRRDRHPRHRCQGRCAGRAAGRRRGVHRQAATLPGTRTARRVVSACPARRHRRQLLHRGGVSAMTDVNFATLVDFAAGGLMLTAVLIVWRRDLRAVVRLLAWQGLALAAIPLLRGAHDGEAALIYVGITIVALRAIALPWLLARALAAEQRDQREATALVNTASSLLITAVLTVAAFAITRPLVNLEPSAATTAVPAAFAVVFIALFVMVTRRHAISQAAGFLMLDNGIAATAFLLTAGVPLIVELGASLDVLFAVIVIGV